MGGAALGATAIQTESDPVAMAALAGYQSAAYWPPDATAPEHFLIETNNAAITITGYAETLPADVVIPSYIGGLPVRAIGLYAFANSLYLTTIIIPNGVTSIGQGAFVNNSNIDTVIIPDSVRSIGSSAFGHSAYLTSIYFSCDAPIDEGDLFNELATNQVTNYVTNPQATGWGATWGGMPVVRLPLYGDKIYQAGELVATTGHVAQAIAAIPEPDMSDHPTFSQIAASNALPYTAWTGTVTPADGTATVAIAHGNMPVLVIDAPTVLQLDATGFGTSGVSRVSLSYYTGTNALTFATNVIKYAETPTVDTNKWNSLLLRRVSNGTWKGVGL
jgi:hypothetical protein